MTSTLACESSSTKPRLSPPTHSSRPSRASPATHVEDLDPAIERAIVIQRSELVEQPIPLTAKLSVVPCRGGEVILRRLFEPLGYRIGERLIRLPRSDQTKRADGLIVYPNRLVVYEIKSKHPRAAGRRGPRTVEEREQELVDIGVGDAAEQLAATISELRGGNLDELLPTQYDWTTTRIVPVIVTAETVPLVWNMWHRFEALAQPIAALPMQDQIARIRLLDIADVERLPDLVQVADAGAVFLEWANNAETFERPLLRHLNVARHELSNDFLRCRYGTVMKLLAERHGLDASKLDFLQDGSP